MIVEVYIDEFKDLVNLSGYTDPITIMLKFRRGLNLTTQDRIAESGTERYGLQWLVQGCPTPRPQLSRE
jgi:hypothetical protein